MSKTIIKYSQYEELVNVLYSQGIIDAHEDVEIQESFGYPPRISIAMAGNINMAVRCGAVIGSIPELADLVINAQVTGDSRLGVVYLENVGFKEITESDLNEIYGV